jgi:hypothetical protein
VRKGLGGEGLSFASFFLSLTSIFGQRYIFIVMGSSDSELEGERNCAVQKRNPYASNSSIARSSKRIAVKKEFLSDKSILE